MSILTGRIFAGRFVIEHIAGSGGMGTVYRAHDLVTDRAVALKLLQVSSNPQDRERFQQEASVLAELDHPGIVSYVGHGAAPDGQRYLALEWLEGEDLGQRLRRGPLSLRETIALLRQVASALAVAHSHGVIHRDLKPSNLFLVGGHLDQAKILDFGIARRMETSIAMTRTGLVVGTPAYMSPEQARGERDITSSTDLFSLGCVIHECLTGVPPFAGEHVAAVLARILFEKPPSLLERRPGMPISLVEIVDRLLDKDPARRPRDAAELSTVIANLTAQVDDAYALPLHEQTEPAEPPFASDEQALLCVVIASSAGPKKEANEPPESHSEQLRRTELHTAIRRLGAHAEWLLDGVLVATLHGLGSATDQVTVAARVALLIKTSLPHSVVALATGRATVLGNFPVGEAVDLAASMLRKQSVESTEATSSGIWIDDLSAALLSRRFALTRKGGIALLSGEELPADESQLLLGRPTPCVGREQELALLDVLLTGSLEESIGQAVLVTARSGIGKTRLCREFLRRVALHPEGALVLSGDGNPTTGGSPYAILQDALRRFCGIGSSQVAESPEVLQELIRTSFAPYVEQATQRHYIAFLAELCGVPFPDDDLPVLRAARNDPKTMGDQITEAVLTLFRAACARSLVILVLDDLQWADALTVKLLGTLLRELNEEPLLVLALARPEVHERFPRLWTGLRVREITLSGLSKKASERLITTVLGKGLSVETVSRMTEQAGGNALFLEELIRAVASGSIDHLPSTVLAILQGRIGQLEPSARRVIRAASIYGSVFWRGGIRALLQAERAALNLNQSLIQLVDAELVKARTVSHLLGDEEYVFRNSLLREAAYSLLTSEDLKFGHRRAAEFLEQAGERDALAIAEHLEKGQLPGKAAEYFLRAGLRSFECNDIGEALLRATRGLSCADSPQVEGELRTLLAMAHCWRSEAQEAFTHSMAARPLVQPGSRWECLVLFHGMWAARMANREAEFSQMAKSLSEFRPAAPEAQREFVLWAALAASFLTSYGRGELAKELLSRAASEQRSAPALANENDLRGALLTGQSDYLRTFECDPWQPLVLSQDATQCFSEIGDRRNQITAMNRLGQAQGELGDRHAGEQTLREALSLAHRLGIPFPILQTELHLAAHLCAGTDDSAHSEAVSITESVLRTPGLSAGYSGWCHGIIASVHLAEKQYAEAVDRARQAMALCEGVPLRLLWVQSLLVQALLATGEVAEANQYAEQMLGALQLLGGGGYIEVAVRRTAAQAFAANGLPERAQAESQIAQERLALRASRIVDPELRARYLLSQG